MKRTKQPTGYIISETPRTVAIATLDSGNRKTGNMVQIWILHKEQAPVAAVQSGADEEICGKCPLRGERGQDRTCYVNVGQAPQQVYRSYRAGRYPSLLRLPHAYAAVFTGRAVRFGAYGDPTLLPLPVFQLVARFADGWTGYTHQWRDPLFAAYRHYLMASCETLAQAEQARAAGWRTFRVTPEGEAQAPSEIL